MKQYQIATLVMAAASTLLGCSGSVGGGGSVPNDPNSNGDSSGTGGEGPPPVSACDGSASASTAPWRRLTKAQLANTVRDLLGEAPDTSGFVADSRTGPFTTNALLPLQDTDVDGYASLAATIAKKIDVAKVVDCNTSTTGEDKCAAQFIKDFGARAYRRPLTSDEEAGFNTIYTAGKADGYAGGIRLVVEAALQSPNFLYLVELGPGSGNGSKALTGHEVATRLSYLFTGTMPDAALFASARSGELNSPDGIAKAAKRLMSGSVFATQAGRFHTELLGVDLLADSQSGVSRSSTQFPIFDAAMRSAMVEEPGKFVEYVMNKGSGSIEELLTAQYVFPSGPLAKVYGGIKADGDGRAEVGDGSRSGLLTLASTMSVHPKIATPFAAVNRGHMVRRDLLCQEVAAAPPGIDFTPPPNAAQLTAQELTRVHQTNNTCKGCHQMMDSIGFAFENYDLLGAYRTKDDKGRTINTSGEIMDLSGGGAFADVREMTQKLAQSQDVRTCLSTQWFRFALGHDPSDADSCTQQLVNKALSSGKGNIRDALLALVTSDSFRFKGEQ